jgi:transcriptional regulator with XRE-family HTH domain
MESKGTDFSQILEALREAGFNDYDMSKLTGIERSKLSKFRTGDRKSPTYDDGCKIMEIYEREVKKRPAKSKKKLLLNV